VSGRDREFDWLSELDCSERDEVDGWSSLSSAQRAEIERLDAEICGLLPCALDPVQPSPECREQLLRRLQASVIAAAPAPEQSAAGVSRWLLPLAAGLTVLALGFAASTVSTLRGQRGELAALRAQVEALTRVAAGSADLEADLAAARDTLELVSGRGVGLCALRPTSAAQSGDEAAPYGLLFVAADHQHWYVRVQGLEKAPDRYYRVWFETADGRLVGAGNLLGEELELSSPTMPEGTRAVHVSLETEPAPAAPSDRILLFGNDMIQVL